MGGRQGPRSQRLRCCPTTRGRFHAVVRPRSVQHGRSQRLSALPAYWHACSRAGGGVEGGARGGGRQRLTCEPIFAAPAAATHVSVTSSIELPMLDAPPCAAAVASTSPYLRPHAREGAEERGFRQSVPGAGGRERERKRDAKQAGSRRQSVVPPQQGSCTRHCCRDEAVRADHAPPPSSAVSTLPVAALWPTRGAQSSGASIRTRAQERAPTRRGPARPRTLPGARGSGGAPAAHTPRPGRRPAPRAPSRWPVATRMHTCTLTREPAHEQALHLLPPSPIPCALPRPGKARSSQAVFRACAGSGPAAHTLNPKHPCGARPHLQVPQLRVVALPLADGGAVEHREARHAPQHLNSSGKARGMPSRRKGSAWKSITRCAPRCGMPQCAPPQPRCWHSAPRHDARAGRVQRTCGAMP